MVLQNLIHFSWILFISRSAYFCSKLVSNFSFKAKLFLKDWNVVLFSFLCSFCTKKGWLFWQVFDWFLQASCQCLKMNWNICKITFFSQLRSKIKVAFIPFLKLVESSAKILGNVYFTHEILSKFPWKIAFYTPCRMPRKVHR